MTTARGPLRHASAMRRALCAAVLSAPLASRAADAAGRRRYAILSLIGDEFRVVTRRATTGTSMDLNEQVANAVDSAVLDDMAFLAADTALADLQPDADRLRASIRDRRLFAAQEELLKPGALDGLRAALRNALAGVGATHLVLVTKRREDARFGVGNGKIGAGRVSGVGFYIDNVEGLVTRATGEASTGYVAAFASVSVDVVELSTLAPHAPRGGFESRLVTPTDSRDAVLAWDAVTPAQKVALLQTVITRAVDQATRAALG